MVYLIYHASSADKIGCISLRPCPSELSVMEKLLVLVICN